MRRFLAGYLIYPALLIAQAPRITAVFNAASFVARGFPNAGIAPGSRIAIVGQNLGPVDPAGSETFPLPSAAGLAGVTARVSTVGSELDLILIRVESSSVIALVPSSVPVGHASITVTRDGLTSLEASVDVVPAAFGIFTYGPSGLGPAMAFAARADGDPAAVSPVEAIRPGSTLILRGTGLGALNGDEGAGPLSGSPATDVTVRIGGQPAAVVSAGRAKCCAGVDEIAVQVPDVSGCAVSVQVVAGGLVSNTATLPVSAGPVCSEPDRVSEGDVRKAAGEGTVRIGSVTLQKIVTLSRAGLPAVPDFRSLAESAFASFSKLSLPPQFSPDASGRPSPGSCLTFPVSGTSSAPAAYLASEALSAGPSISIVGPKGTRTLTLGTSGYSAQITDGSVAPAGLPALPGTAPPATPEFFAQGVFTVDSTGATGNNGVGRLRASIPAPPAFEWSNGTASLTVSREAGFEVRWSGGDAGGLVAVSGVSLLAGSNQGEGFVCIERTAAGRLRVPESILAALPASTQAAVGVANISKPVAFTADGLDRGSLEFATTYQTFARVQ